MKIKHARKSTAGKTQSWEDVIDQKREHLRHWRGVRRRFSQCYPFLLLAFFFSGAGLLVWSLKDRWSEIERRILVSENGSPFISSIQFETNGVLTQDFVKRTFNVYEGAFPIDGDIFQLKRALESMDQVVSASVQRSFALGSLTIRLNERIPSYKLVAEIDGHRRLLLVDESGVAFAPLGYSRMHVERLPLIAGVALRANGDGFQAIEGIEGFNTIVARMRELSPEAARRLLVVEVKPLAPSEPVLGVQFALKLHGCERLLVTASAIDDQLIRLNTLINSYTEGWLELERRPLPLVDLTYEGRAVLQGRTVASSPNRGGSTSTAPRVL